MTHPFKCVEVLWVDCCSTGEGWTGEKNLPTPKEMTTRGWLVHEVEDYVCIAGTYYKDGNDFLFGEVIAIPHRCILSVTELEINDKNARRNSRPKALR